MDEASSTNMALVKRTFALSGDVEFECWILTVEHANSDREFWFKGRDVAKFLGYNDPRQAVTHNVPEEWRTTWSEFKGAYRVHSLQIPSNWQPHTIFINEGGLYALILRSKKPEALQFQKWVCGEVLPALRCEGIYVVGGTRRIDENQQRLFEMLREEMELKQQRLFELLREEIDSNKQLVRSILHEAVDMEGERAAMTDSGAMRHTFSLYIRKKEDDAIEREYVAIRCQKRKLRAALKTVDANSYVRVLYRENVPNSINVLAKSKEILRRDGVPYKVWGGNKIRTTAAFERVAADVLNGERKFSRALELATSGV